MVKNRFIQQEWMTLVGKIWRVSLYNLKGKRNNLCKIWRLSSMYKVKDVTKRPFIKGWKTLEGKVQRWKMAMMNPLIFQMKMKMTVLLQDLGLLDQIEEE